MTENKFRDYPVSEQVDILVQKRDDGSITDAGTALLAKLRGAFDGRQLTPEGVAVQESIDGPPKVSGFQDFFTGENRREENLPGLFGMTGLDTGAQIRMAAAANLNPDEHAVADSAEANIPGLERSEDSYGNVILEFTEGPNAGQRVFVNPPGLDVTDTTQIFSEIVNAFPAAKWANMAASGILRAVRAAFGEAGTQIAGDVAAGSFGSEQGVDFVKAGMAGVGGSMGQVAGDLASKWVRRHIFTRKYFLNGQLTGKGKKAARDAGLNPDEIDQRMAAALADELSLGRDPVTAANTALGRRFGVTTMTAGQKTLNFPQLERELALEGKPGASSVMSSAKRRQRAQVEGAIDEVEGTISGRHSVAPSIVDAGAVAKEGMARQRNDLLGEIKAAYDKLLGRNSEFMGKPADIAEFSDAIRKIANDYDINEILTPGAARVVTLLGKLKTNIASSAKHRGYQVPPRMMTRVMLNEMILLRKQITANINSIPSANDADRALAIKLRGKYDEMLDDVVDRALFEGDETLFADWGTAKGLRKELTQRFGERFGRETDEAGRVIEMMFRTNADARETANYILGAGKLGGAKLSAKIVARLGTSLGRETEEFIAIKSMALKKMLRPGSRDLTISAMSNNIKEARVGNPDLWKELWTPEEAAFLKQFENLVELLDIPSDVRAAVMAGNPIGAIGRTTAGRLQSKFTFAGHSLSRGLPMAILRELFFPTGGRPMRTATAALSTLPVYGLPTVTAAGAGTAAQLRNPQGQRPNLLQ